MSEKETPLKSKMLKLKAWLTLPDAARHLSILFGEDVSEADILQLALDRHLKLSVYFVNGNAARLCSVVPKEKHKMDIWSKEEDKHLPTIVRKEITEEEFQKLPEEIIKGCLNGSMILVPHGVCYLHEKEGILTIDDTTIYKLVDDLYDLLMIGNERVYVEQMYQQLTDGPEVEHIGMDGAFVEGQNGKIYQLQERFDDYFIEKMDQKINTDDTPIKDRHREKEKRPYNHPDNYFPAGTLPSGSVLVVRTSALLDLQERISAENTGNDRHLAPTAKRSLLKMILAMAIEGYGYDPNDKKSQTPQEIVADAAKNDHSINVDTARKWLKEAAKLPKDPA